MKLYKVKRFTASEAEFMREFCKRFCPGVPIVVYPLYPHQDGNTALYIYVDRKFQFLTEDVTFTDESLVDF